MALRKLLLSIEYDGTNFHGWQIQNELRTVQGCVEEAIKRITKSEVRVIGASRTDCGVHARDQKAVFTTAARIESERIPIALNSMLPLDIRIKACEEVDMDFNLFEAVTHKTYRYSIYNNRIRCAIGRFYNWFCPYNLDVDLMQEAARILEGKHDFSAFKAASTEVKTTVRTIFSCNVTKEANNIYIDVTGDGFLYNMVRIISGTLVEVGRGRMTKEDVKYALESMQRSNAGCTAPPEGLCLQKIYLML